MKNKDLANTATKKANPCQTTKLTKATTTSKNGELGSSSSLYATTFLNLSSLILKKTASPANENPKNIGTIDITTSHQPEFRQNPKHKAVIKIDK
uniref:Uncharacterized protein n=1 Tax=viral metagenome TaxID=1070528 RepID=A0A6M3M114_9ZZZZ